MADHELAGPSESARMPDSSGPTRSGADPTAQVSAEQIGRLKAQLLPSSGFYWEAVDPAWQALFHAYVAEGMYRREVLDQKTRELCAIAAIAVGGWSGVMRRHVLSALEYGASREEILEVLLQISVYAGFPATQAALVAYRDTLALLDAGASEG